MNIPILTSLKEALVDKDSCVVEGIILQSGLSRNGTYYPPDVVNAAAPIFQGVKCYADHPSEADAERSVRDVVGAIEKSWADDGVVHATILLSRSHDWLLTMIAEGLLGDLSINALGKTKVSRHDGRVVREVIAITKAFSVDFVTDAAAGGHIDKILRESASYEESLKLIERISVEELSDARPDLIEKIHEQYKNDFLMNLDGAANEIDSLRKKLDSERETLHRELIARELVRTSGLPESSHEFLIEETLSLRAEGQFHVAVSELIEKHREYLARLTSIGLIKGMGSVKVANTDGSKEHLETLRLMGVG